MVNDNKIDIACSGASYVGYISDQIGRKLLIDKQCKMSCMVHFVTCDTDKIEEFKRKNILVIDGCNEDCGKKIIKSRDIKNFSWLRLTDLSYEKGKTSDTVNTIKHIYEEALILLS